MLSFQFFPLVMMSGFYGFCSCVGHFGVSLGKKSEYV